VESFSQFRTQLMHVQSRAVADSHGVTKFKLSSRRALHKQLHSGRPKLYKRGASSPITAICMYLCGLQIYTKSAQQTQNMDFSSITGSNDEWFAVFYSGCYKAAHRYHKSSGYALTTCAENGCAKCIINSLPSVNTLQKH
jgi:hypothetical protein